MFEAAVLRRSLVGGVFLLLFAIYGFVFIFNEILPWKDDSIYLVLGESLAEGRGYRNIDDPETPPHENWPFFYPFVLSLVWRMFPDFPGNLVYFRFLSVVAAVGFLWLTYCYFVRFSYATRLMALVTVVLAGLNPVFVIMGDQVLTDMAYSLISIGALYCLGRWQTAPLGAGIRFPLLATGLLAVAPVTRYIGISLNAAAVLAFIRQRDYRNAILITLGMLLVLGPWAVWVYGNQATGYAQAFTFSLHLLAPNVAKKILHIGQYSIPYYIFPHLLPTSRPLQYLVGFTAFRVSLFLVQITITVLCLIGTVRWIRTRQQILAWYLVGYVLILLVIISDGIPERWLVPISPFLVLAMLQGLEFSVSGVVRIWKGGRLQVWGKDLAVGSVIGLGVMSSLVATTRVMYNAYTYGHVRGAEAAETERACQAVANWVKTNIPQRAVIASMLPSFLFLYTGRAIVPVSPTLEPRWMTVEDVERRLQGKNVEYLVHFFRGFGSPIVSKSIHQSPESFNLLYRSSTCAEVYGVRDLRSR